VAIRPLTKKLTSGLSEPTSVFARHIGRGRLEFTPLSGTIRDVPPRSLWETVTGFDIQDFAFDPDQDLLIALEAM
jgi:hypothetical protein